VVLEGEDLGGVPTGWRGRLDATPVLILHTRRSAVSFPGSNRKKPSIRRGRVLWRSSDRSSSISKISAAIHSPRCPEVIGRSTIAR
jgi:hypothetical protein